MPVCCTGPAIRRDGVVSAASMAALLISCIFLSGAMADDGSGSTVVSGGTYVYRTPFSDIPASPGETNYTFRWSLTNQSGHEYASSTDSVFRWRVLPVSFIDQVLLRVVVVPNGCEECAGSSTRGLTIVPGTAKVRINKTCVFDSPARMGDDVTYLFEVTNAGNVPLSNVTVTDLQDWGPGCNPEYYSGDDGDRVLKPGQRWIYRCNLTIPDPERLYTQAARPAESERDLLIRKLLRSKVRLEIKLGEMARLREDFDLIAADLNISSVTINGTNDTNYTRYNYTSRITGEYLAQSLDSNGTIRTLEYWDFITGDLLISEYNSWGALLSDTYRSSQTREYLKIEYDRPYEDYNTFTVIDYALGDSLIVIEGPSGQIISREYRKTPGAPPEDETFTLMDTATVTAYTPWDDRVTDTAFYTLVFKKPLPELRIDKTASPSPAVPGGIITYTITYANTGEVDASGVVINETYDRNVTYVSASKEPDFGSRNLWTIGNLPRGSAGALTVRVLLSPGTVARHVHNKVNITCSKSVCAEFNLTTEVVNNYVPDIIITKSYVVNGSPGKRAAKVGDKVTYTYAIKNTGNVLLNQTNVTDDRLGWISSLYNRELKPGEEIAVAAEYMVKGADLPGPLDDAARVRANSTILSRSGIREVTNLTRADLSLSDIILEKSYDVGGLKNTGAAKPGDVITYQYDIKNNGSTAINLTRLTDTFEQNGTLIDIPIDPSHRIIAKGKRVTYTYSYRVSEADLHDPPVPLNSTARVEGYDLDRNVLTSEARTSVGLLALRLTKTPGRPVASVGDSLIYKYEVVNRGTADLTLENLTDNRTEDIFPDPKGHVIKKGHSAIFTGTYTVIDIDGPKLANFASVTGIDDRGNPVSANATASVDIVMRLIKEANERYAGLGETVLYTYTVWNNGRSEIVLSSIKDDLVETIEPDPAGTSIPPGQSARFSGRYTVTEEDLPGPVVNHATAEATDASSNPLTARAFASVNISKIRLIKTADRPVASAGDDLTYTYRVENFGTGEIILESLKDNRTEDISPDPEGIILEGGESAIFKGTYIVKGTEGTKIVNGATVKGRDDMGTVLRANATASVEIEALKLIKAANKTYAGLDEAIGYSYMVWNNGTETIVLESLDDDLVETIEPNPAGTSILPGQSAEFSGTYIVSAKDLPGPVVNHAVVKARDASDNLLTAEANASVSLSAIRLTKTADRSEAAVGDSIKYTYYVENRGSTDLEVSWFSDEVSGGGVKKKPNYEIDKIKGHILESGSSATFTDLADYEVVDEDLPGPLVNNATIWAVGSGGRNTSSSASVSVAISPLRLTKAADKTFAEIGDVIKYTYAIKNTGSGTITLRELTDDRIENLPDVSGESLASGQSYSAEVSFTVPPDTESPLINNAVVTGEDDKVGEVSASDSASVDIVQGKLEMIKEAKEYRAGRTITYAYTIINYGPNPIDLIELKDVVLGSGAEVPTPDVSSTTLQPHGASGDTATFTATYRIRRNDPLPIINEATITGRDTVDGEIVEAKATAEVASVKMLSEVPESIGVIKTANRTRAGEGDVIRYKYAIWNWGQSSITLQSLNDDHVTAITPDPSGEVIEPGGSLTFTGDYAVTESDYRPPTDPCNPVLENNATVRAVDNSGESVVGYGYAVVQLVPASLNLTINPSKKTAKVGEVIAYEYRLTNAGGVTLSNIQLNLRLKDGTLIAVPINRTALRPGEAASGESHYKVSDSDLPGPLMNNATASATLLCKDASASASVDLVSLEITKTASSDLVLPGDRLTYTLAFRNDGSGEAWGVRVNDIIDPDLEFNPERDATPPPEAGQTRKTDRGQQYQWNITSLKPGEVSSIELRVRVKPTIPKDKGKIGNWFRIDSDPADEDKEFHEMYVDVINYALWITKAANKLSYSTGEFINYTLRYGNNMGLPATEVVVADRLPDLEFFGASPYPDGISGNQLLWYRGTLNPGDNGTITVTMKIPKRPNMTFDEQSYVSGEGFVYVNKRMDTTYERRLVENMANITGYFKEPSTGRKIKDMDNVSLLVSVFEPGTRLKTVEHGSGYYEEEMISSLRTFNRSIMISKDVFAKHRDTIISLPGGRRVEYRSNWSDRTAATNDVRDERVLENYRYMDVMDKESTFILDENQTVYRSSSTFSGGMADIGFVRVVPETKALGTRKVAAEIMESYHGSFNLEERLDSYGTSIAFAKHARGMGFTLADFRNGRLQRSFEQGSGYYASDLYTSTGTLYKEVDLRFLPNSRSADGRRIDYGTKWHEEIFTRDQDHKALISERITGADYIKKDSIISGATMGIYGEFEGTAEIKAVQKQNPDSKPEIKASKDRISSSRDKTVVEEVLSGRFKIDTTISVHANPMYVRPHINITKTALRLGEDSAIFRINLTNDGNKTLGPVYVTDIMPEGMTYLNSSLRPEIDGRNLTWTILSMPIAGRQSIELGVRLDNREMAFRNRAKVTATYSGGQVHAEAVSRLVRDWGAVVEIVPDVNRTLIVGEGWGGEWAPPREYGMNSSICDCDLGPESECDSCPAVIAVGLPI